jgi:polysaccharide export outer membrane protein
MLEYFGFMEQRVSIRRAWRTLSIGCVAIALTACASKPLDVPYNPSDFGAPDPVQVAQVPDVIAPGDKIHVTVFDVDSLSGDYRVEENGQIDYPLIGIVQAEGHTASELAKILAAKLGERNLRNPNVQVAVVERAPQTITIEGAVKQPAVVPIRGKSTLLQAIALGGGTSDDAIASQIVVFRQVNGKRMAAAFDLRAIRRNEAPDPEIYPNDVVVVPGSRNKKLVDRIFQAIPIIGIFRPF